MIVVYHQNNKILKVIKDQTELLFENQNIAQNLMTFAKKYPTDLLIWCHIDLKSYLNFVDFDAIFHHNKIMVSFNGSNKLGFIPDEIGFIEDSVYLNINKKVTYPTWCMSSAVGGINAKVLSVFGGKIQLDENFDYFLNSLGKIGLPKGLICYSEPRLLMDNTVVISNKKTSDYDLFKFVKQHYKSQWVFMLLLNFMVFKKRVPFLPLLNSLRFKNQQNNTIDLSKIEVKSTLKVVDLKTIDVIIPTIGRKKYLYDVLQDLAKQTHLPYKVIIVEQNPDPGSNSELDYLTLEKWPFLIKHIFTHQSGACNARNVALSQVSSEWIFFNDDDNRFDENLLWDAFSKIEQYGNYVASTSYMQKNEKLTFKIANQSGIFGSGNSFVKASCLKNISFSKALEFGYGEDVDYGIQLRNQGFDILYFPELKILHLKAPFGGFRIKPELAWKDEEIQPKPSPTIMYIKQKHFSREQVAGYKLILFLKTIRNESVFNWFNFYKLFEKRWSISEKWSKKL